MQEDRRSRSSKFDGVRAKALQGLSVHIGHALTTGDADDSGLGISLRLFAFDLRRCISLSFFLTLHSPSLQDLLSTSTGYERPAVRSEEREMASHTSGSSNRSRIQAD